MGLNNPEADKLPGKSFAPLLKGEKIERRDNVVVFDEYGPVRMIRTEQWKYVHRYVYGPHELYNLKEDPCETKNLSGQSEAEGMLEELKSKLDGFFMRYAEPHAGWEPRAGDRRRTAILGRPERGGKRGDEAEVMS